MDKNYYKKSNINSLLAFTLTELSIVLAIISLLAVVTLSGRFLIRESQIKSSLASVDELKSAIGQFELLYNALPGDFKNASDYWSAVASGNNDRIIDAGTEDFLAMQHLSLAELIKGEYSGVLGLGLQPSVNIMEASIEGSGMYFSCCAIGSSEFNNYVGLFIPNLADTNLKSGVVTPTEAYDIDLKLDDGNPDQGKLIAFGNWDSSINNYSSSNCFSSSGINAIYEKTGEYRDRDACHLYFAYDW